MMPPNPIRNLDNSLTAAQKRGSDFYFGDRPSDGFKILVNGESITPNNNCNGCIPVRVCRQVGRSARKFYFAADWFALKLLPPTGFALATKSSLRMTLARIIAH